MKTVVYITKSKIWAGETAYDWDGTSFDLVFGRIKKEQKIDEMRVVLGNDISFVTAVKAEETFLNRENVLKMIKSWMPFEVDSNCFDWKEVTLGHNEVWIQIVAIEKELLMSLSSAIKKNGMRVDLVTAIGVLLGEKTIGREAPVVLKWTDKESLTVLAVNGLVDLVVSDIVEEDLMVYASQRWNLAVNPEVITLGEKDFKLSEDTFSEKTKGEDRLILNLPILKDIVETAKPETSGKLEGFTTETGETVERVEEKTETKRSKSKLWILLLILVLVLGGAVFAMYKYGLFKAIFPDSVKTEEVAPSPTPTAEVTPVPTAVDLSAFSVQVLNGSGVTGEAARIKEDLITSGFVEVDTGNTGATTEGVIRHKDTVPQSAVEVVGNSIKDYKLGSPSALTTDDKYDLIIILGSAKSL